LSDDYVVDASAGVELLLGTAIGEALRTRLPIGTAWVPELYFAEAAAALRRLEISGAVSAARAAVAFGDLVASTVRRVQVRPLLSEAWSLRHNVTIADGLYVVLACHLAVPLVTADTRLTGAPALNVTTIAP
jgi:predicted nucleic acid-binding protein